MAERTAENRRQCPTRESGAHSLIAHWITPAVCLERQRRNYHKCYACQYRGLAADVVLAPVPGDEPSSTPPAVPVRKATSKKLAGKTLSA